MKKIIVTGVTGVVGMALVEELISEGHLVYCVLNPHSTKNISFSNSENIIPIALDLSDVEELLPTLINCEVDAFYHLGWANTSREFRNDVSKQIDNIKYTIGAVNVASKLGAKTFVGAGSQAEYGRSSEPIKEDLNPNPEVAYGATKLSAGKLSALQCKKLGIKHIWTRVFSVYGAYDAPSTLIVYCINKLLRGERPVVTRCTQVWDYLHSSDAAKALVLCEERGVDGNVYNIGSGIGMPLMDYLSRIEWIINSGAKIGFGEKEYQGGELMHLCADISKIKRCIGFVPMVSFTEGIKKTINWCEGQLNE